MGGSRLLRDAWGVANTNTFTTVLRFVIGVLIARELGPAGKGLFASLMVVPNLIYSITELGIRRAAVQHLGEKKFPSESIMASLIFFFLFSALVGILISGLTFAWLAEPAYTPGLVALVLLGIPPQMINKFANGVFAGQQDFRSFNHVRALPLVFQLLAILILVSGMHLAVAGALASILFSSIITTGFAIYRLRGKFRLRPAYHPEILKSLLSLGFVYALAMFLMKLNFRIDLLLLQQLSSLEEVGFYNQGVTVAEGWQAPFTLGAVVLSGTASSRDQDSMNIQIGQLFRLTLLMVLLAAGLVWLTSPWFVPFVYGQAFAPSVQVVRWIIPAIILIVMARMLASRIAGLRKTMWVIWVYFPALILNIGINLILIPKYGSMGAVMASNISYTLSAIGITIVYCRVSGQSLVDLFRYRRSDFDVVSSLVRKLRRRFRIGQTHPPDSNLPKA